MPGRPGWDMVLGSRVAAIYGGFKPSKVVMDQEKSEVHQEKMRPCFFSMCYGATKHGVNQKDT